MVMSVVEAVRRDLVALGDSALAESAEAAAALALARELDRDGNSATSKSMCARALVEAMARLRERAPARDGADGLDEIAAKRRVRRGEGGA